MLHRVALKVVYFDGACFICVYFCYPVILLCINAQKQKLSKIIKYPFFILYSSQQIMPFKKNTGTCTQNIIGTYIFGKLLKFLRKAWLW